MLCFKRSMIHRLAFSGAGGAGEEEIATARAAEIENCHEILKALAARRPWLQSPSGEKTMKLAEDGGDEEAEFDGKRSRGVIRVPVRPPAKPFGGRRDVGVVSGRAAAGSLQTVGFHPRR